MDILVRNSEHVSDCRLIQDRTNLTTVSFMQEVNSWLKNRKVVNIERMPPQLVGDSLILNLTLSGSDR